MSQTIMRASSTPRITSMWRCLAVAAAFCLLLATPALADPVWRIDSLSNTTVQPGATFEYLVEIRNVGDADMNGSPINLRVRLPAGILAEDAVLTDWTSFNTYSCTAGDGVSPIAGASEVLCTNSEPVPFIRNSTLNFQQLALTTTASPSISGMLVTELEVSGGGAATVTTVDPVTASPTLPGFGIDAFDGEVVADTAGTPYTQAGGHPYAATVAIDFNTLTNPLPLKGALYPVEPVKNVLVDLPAGFVGNPAAAPRCSLAQLSGPGELSNQTFCPAASQVGTTIIRLRAQDALSSIAGPLPVYNLEPPPNVPARFGFNFLGSLIVLDGQVRSSGDYGLTVNAANIPEAIGMAGTTVTFWGNPASSEHNFERACPGQNPPGEGGPICENGGPEIAFLRNPTSCTAPGVGLPVTARIDSWENPGVFREATWFSHVPPGYPNPPARWGAQIGPTDCDRVPFSPSLSARPAVGVGAGKPAGFTFDLSMPQTDDPAVIGHADLKRAVVTLPLGVRVSPSSADGLGACSPAQIGVDNGDTPSCPDSSRIGSVQIDTPLLEEPLQGSVYLARQRDNPFGSLLAIYLVAEGPGVVIKLPGRVDAHPLSGQLTTTFDDNPQLPFSNLRLEFKGGPRAPLVLPKQCGTHTTNATMTSWSGRTVATQSSFVVDRGCGGQFTPDFQAGTSNPVAGESSSFLLRLARDDEDQEISSLSVDMPSGLTGRIADVPLCPEANARAGSCSDASKIGDVTVGAGAGTNPFFITNGRAYLTGPYRGAPFGLSVVVPAVAGPFDLGNVNVRQALFVGKHTAEIRVVSDPFPTILEGIPLDVRDVRVAINRPGFFLNPTSCADKTITGVITSTAGAKANVSSRFEVGECAALPLRPRMTLTVGGRRSTQRGRTTPFTATLRQTAGQSALRRVRVTLPTTINARLTVINDACTRAQYEAGRCEDARTGSATAVTPLLRDPLRGGVYFVRNGNPLPDLFVSLRGQVDFDLIGRITIPGSKRLRTSFNLVPDVPVSRFTLRLNGGRRGSVGNAANLCSRRGRTARAELSFVGQNGKELDVRQRLKVRGCRARAGRRGGRARRGGRR